MRKAESRRKAPTLLSKKKYKLKALSVQHNKLNN